MFGIEDKSVWAAYLLCILSTLLCVAYGLISWNRGEDVVDREDIAWVSEEEKLEEGL